MAFKTKVSLRTSKDPRSYACSYNWLERFDDKAIAMATGGMRHVSALRTLMSMKNSRAFGFCEQYVV
jgi:hypothetical protein